MNTSDPDTRLEKDSNDQYISKTITYTQSVEGRGPELDYNVEARSYIMTQSIPNDSLPKESKIKLEKVISSSIYRGVLLNFGELDSNEEEAFLLEFIGEPEDVDKAIAAFTNSVGVKENYSTDDALEVDDFPDAG